MHLLFTAYLLYPSPSVMSMRTQLAMHVAWTWRRRATSWVGHSCSTLVLYLHECCTALCDAVSVPGWSESM